MDDKITPPPATQIAVLLLLSLLTAFLPQPLAAQHAPVVADVMDMSLEDLMKIEIDSVFGASGYKQNVTDAPASITIVTAAEIARYGYRTLADILRNVPGVYVTSDRDSSYLGIRGFGSPGGYNSRILLLLDGHRISDPVTGWTVVGMDFPVDIDLIERVEVIRGPNSSLYVASALLGVVNVITKQARDTNGFTVSGETASYGAYRTRLTYAHQFENGFGMLLSGSYMNSHGPDQLYFKEFDSPFTNNGIANNADGSQSVQEFAKFTYRGFTLEGAYASSVQTDPAASYGAIFNDPGERFRVMPGYVDLSYDHNLGGDWGYVGRLYYDNDRYHGTLPIDESPFGGASRVLNQDHTSGQDLGAAFSLSKKLPLSQTLILGAEYRENFLQHEWNYDTQPYALYFDGRQQSNIWGVHIQDKIPLRNNLVLDLGLSYDRYSTFGGSANPRAALIYQPFEGTSLKFLFAKSFRAPTADELYYTVSNQTSNPNLQPETAKTLELVWEQALPRGFNMVASGYYYPVRGLINAETDPVSGIFSYENGQRVDLKGAEITVKRQSRYGLEAALSLSLQYAKTLGSSDPLINSPKVLSQASLSVPLFKGRVFASMDLQYVSRRRTLAGEYAGAYVLPNFTLYSTQKALRGWELSASVYNAFNGIYGDPASIAHVQDVIYQDGRTYRMKFTYHF